MRKPLRVVRTEFGFKRTACGCPQCQTPCEFIPGFLVPSDIARLKTYLDADAPSDNRPTLEQFAELWLLASPGAVVAKAGQMFRIPTIVPARRPDTACIFFVHGKCGVWPAAPYGCAFFDSHQGAVDGDSRANAGLTAVWSDIQADGPYSRLWKHLKAKGLEAAGPEVCRQLMKEAMEIRRTR